MSMIKKVVSFLFVLLKRVIQVMMKCRVTVKNKDVRREDKSLLQKFVPVNLYSESSVRRMMSQDVRSRRVTTHECSQCGYQTKYRSHLVHHTRSHTGEKPYQCKLCQKKFSQIGYLNTHVLTHKDIKRFQCDLCVYKTTTRQNLARHHMPHTGERPFACDQCKFSTIQKSALVTHKRSHTGEKPYSCTLCDFRSSHTGNVTQHIC